MNYRSIKKDNLREASALLIREWEAEGEKDLNKSDAPSIKMAAAQQKKKVASKVKKRRRHRFLVAAAMIAIAIISWISFTPSVKAGVAEWIKSVFEGATQYHFVGEIKNRDLPVFRLGWYPDNGKIAHEMSGDMPKDYDITILYEEEGTLRDVLGFTYGFFDEGTAISITSLGNECIQKTVKIKGWTIDEYYSVGTDEYDYYWMDTEKHIYFLLYSTFDKQTNLKIINSIVGEN